MCLKSSVAVGGSATENVDYNLFNKNFFYNPGDSPTKTFTISTTDDGRLEGQETITLTLSSLTSHVTPGDIATMTVTIIDNDGLYHKFHLSF